MNIKCRLKSETTCVCGEKMWLAALDSNRIYEYDLIRHETRLICTIHEESTSGYRLFSDIVLTEDKAFLVPFNAHSMYSVDLITNEVREIKIPNMGTKANFVNGFYYNGEIWLICALYYGFVRYNPINEEMDTFCNWIGGKGQRSVHAPYFRRTVLKNSTLYAPMYKSNSLLEYNLDTQEFEYHVLDIDCDGWAGICIGDDNWAWLISADQLRICKYNIDSKCVQVIDTDELSDENSRYANIVGYNGMIIGLPLAACTIIYVKNDECIAKDLGKSTWCVCEFWDDKIVIFDVNEGILRICGSDGVERKKVVIVFDEDSKNRNESMVLKEGVLTIDDFIEML